MSDAMSAPLFERGVAPTEKLYLAGLDVVPPVCLHLFVEGVGAIDEHALRAAIATAAQSLPGCRLVLQGRGRHMRWGEQPTPPPLRVLSEPVARDDFASLSFLKEPVDPRRGPTCSVVLMPGPCVVFRAFHGVMDGMGVLSWMREVFRALRDETVVAHTDRQLDFEIARLEGPRPVRAPVAADAPCALVPRGARVREFAWTRRRLERATRLSAPALVVALAQLHATLGETRPIRCTVPVDLRARVPRLANTGNLSLPLFLTVPLDATVAEVSANMLGRLASGQERAEDPTEAWLARLPRWLVAWVFRLICWVGSRFGRFPATAIVSHLGKLQVAHFSTPTYQAETVWALPVHAGIAPLAFAVVELGDHVEVVCCAPADDVSQRRVEALLDEVVADSHGSAAVAPPREALKEAVDTSTLESELKALLEQVSLEPDLSEVEADMNFFELGIVDSFAFVRLIEMIQTKYGVSMQEQDYSSGAFFTLRGIASWVGAQRSGEQSA